MVLRITTGIVLGLAAALLGAARAQDGARTAERFETIPVEGVPDVYIFRYGKQQAMFIVTPAGVLATDPMSHKNEAVAAKYVAEIKKKTNSPIKFVVYSHSHARRSGGGQLFKDEGATIIAHARAKDALERLKNTDREFDTIMPDEIVEEGTPRVITLGGKEIIIRDVGRNYSNDMLVVLLPQEKLLFASDFIPLKALPETNSPGSWIPGWEKSLQTVEGLDWQRLVPGVAYDGGRLGTKQDVQDLAKYFSDLSAEVRSRVDDCWITAMEDIELPAYENWTNYKGALRGNVERYCYYWTAQ